MNITTYVIASTVYLMHVLSTLKKYKLLCPRGHKPARWPWPTSPMPYTC